MLHFPCASLSNLAKSLREKYAVRSKMIVRNFPDSNLLAAEYEIIRVNRMITRHRRRCPNCKLHEIEVMMNPKRLRYLAREIPELSTNLAS
jgi:hypothetical protein